MKENIKLAFRGIKNHKMRSFLTMLGIIIGIAAIIAIVSTIKGTNEQIKNNLIGSGNNAVTVTLYQGDWTYETQYNGVPEGFLPITDETIEEVLEVPEIVSASRFILRSYADGIFHENSTLSGGSLYGIDTNYFDVVGYQVSKGRSFVEQDYTDFRKVAVVNETAAGVLFEGEDPIGKTVEIMGEPFVVVGVVKQRTEFKPVINTVEDYYTYTRSDSGSVYIPLGCWPIIYQFDEPESLLVKARNTDSMTAAGERSAEILNSHSTADTSADGAVHYKSDDILQRAQQLQDLSASTNSMLIWIAGISLLVGGIGVMNIMLVSVTERTREIGLKKALGARKNSIMMQFLTEAAVLTSIGGLLGVVVGVGLAYVVSAVAKVPVAISGAAILISLLFSTVVGIVFGLLPSLRASNLDPIEALRYE